MNPSRLDRVLRILEYLSGHQEGAALTALCDDLSIPMSSAHDLMGALVAIDAVRLVDGRAYVLGPRSVVMALAITDSVDLRRISGPFLAELCESVNENSYLAVRTGDSVSYADRHEAGQSLSVVMKLGNPRPLHSTSVGKLMTAYNRDLEQLLLDGEGLEATTPRSLISAQQLGEELASIRRRGFSVSDGESVEGIIGLATPIFDASGTVSAAVHVSAPRGRLDTERLPRTLHAMLVASTSISKQLGAPDELLRPFAVATIAAELGGRPS